MEIIYIALFLLPIAFILAVDWKLTTICTELKRSNNKLAGIYEELKINNADR